MKGEKIVARLRELDFEINVPDLYSRLRDWNILYKGEDNINRGMVPGTTMMRDPRGYEYTDFSEELCESILERYEAGRVRTLDPLVFMQQTSSFLTKRQCCELKYLRRQFYTEHGQSLHTVYLNSPRWVNIRERALRTQGAVCYRCEFDGKPMHGKSGGLILTNNYIVVHHMTYQNWMDERNEELIVLCRNCHGDIHRDFTPDHPYFPGRKFGVDVLKQIRKYIKEEVQC